MRSPGGRTNVLDPSRLVAQLLNEKRLNTFLLLEKLSEILLNHIQNLEFFPVSFRCLVVKRACVLKGVCGFGLLSGTRPLNLPFALSQGAIVGSFISEYNSPPDKTDHARLESN
ncbi:hypothetical protein VNO78_16355 [Psophocarpus tetragonolobus]|uniref:Uncharacterized protein n=1 Tax=Psophocarpus tetragonolobus TaxID=3891 RepID=A0AAN9SI68_PSOTE